MKKKYKLLVFEKYYYEEKFMKFIPDVNEYNKYFVKNFFFINYYINYFLINSHTNELNSCLK